ncbi:MAG TPA: Crp/Fnr family transcriptional regulator [Rhizobiaceae bacterium]
MSPGTDAQSAARKFAQFLGGAPYHLRFSTADLDQVHSLPVVTRHYAPRTVIGAARHADLFIDSGWAIAHKPMPSGDRVVIDFLQRGDLVTSHGSSGLASIEAITDVTTFEIQKSWLAAQNPSIARIMVSLVDRNWRIAVEHFANVSGRPPLDRIACLFLEIAYRLSQSHESGSDWFGFPFTQRDLADALGMTSIHMNRLLRVLRESEMLRFQHWTVELTNRRGLIEKTHFDPEYLDMKLDTTG